MANLSGLLFVAVTLLVGLLAPDLADPFPKNLVFDIVLISAPFILGGSFWLLGRRRSGKS